MTLEQWQTRLQSHFAAMAKERSATGHPVFALEHGLDDAERRTLASDVRASLLIRPPSDAYWLPWVVYATEVGYTYDGEEYWQTFEESTPGWATCRSRPRDWLRDRFVRFQKSYHGLQPSGRWASWFSIIAWPIQHAVLPVYLQYHLAKLLYELRYEFTPQLLTDAAALGRYLHAESTRSVKRLQEFAEEHALIGTIATALLLSGDALTNVFILPKTLHRLIADLEKEQRARDWLRVAQDQARKISVRGTVAKGTPTTKTAPTTNTISKADVPDLEGRILVVREAAEWRVYFETPELTGLVARFPQFRSVLANSRCSVGVGGGRWQAPGWLLYGPHRVPLAAWPKPGEVMISLDKGDLALASLFRADSLLRPGTTWVFRVGTDGIGYEIRSLAVRAGQRYLIAKTAGELPIEKPAVAVKMGCSGIKAALIDVPSFLDQQTARYLERLGLNVWQTVRIWPAGLSVPGWDGEGRAEWLVTDQILVGIAADQPIGKALLSLDGGFSLTATPTEQSSPIFVALPQLDLGIHQLKVRVQNAGSNPAEHSGVMEISIRSPRTRPEAYKSLFRVAVSPERVSLDDFWRGAASIDIYGPENRSVTPRIELAAAFGLPALATKTMPAMRMPVSAEAWRAAFRDQCNGNPVLDNHFDEAKECRLYFEAGDLGSSVVRLEHDRRPLRWNAQRTSQGFRLRLINEALDDDGTFVELYPYDEPDKATTRPGKDFATSIATPPPSGLFSARNQMARAGIITPPAIILKGLSSLGLRPKLAARRPQADKIAELVCIYERWANARIIHHPLAFSFRTRVLSTIDSALIDLIYPETKTLGSTEQPVDEAGLGRLCSSINEYSIRAMLPAMRSEALRMSTHERPAYVARRLFPLLSLGMPIPSPDPNNAPQWIAEFALRFASAPEALPPWSKDRLQVGLQFLVRYHQIVRVARYLVLASEVGNGARPLSAGPLRGGWEWS